MNALELFEDGNRSIKHVAGKIDFSSAASFAHAFKEIPHLTPTKFILKK
jgi:AraC-like DNA-binding protein